MKTILIVDDDLNQRELLKTILSDEYNVIEASDGAKALEIINADPTSIDLMLLDVMMPGLDGIEVLQKLDDDNIIDKLAIIIISADDSRESVGGAFILGVEKYIAKPLNVNEVLQAVKEVI